MNERNRRKQIKLDYIDCGNCLDKMKELPDECIDLTVTSPPYDNLRTYNGYCFDFENIAKELYRVTKQGGVVVWIVNDAVENGSETGTSFRQALFFKEIGFNIHDTMIWLKDTFTFPDPLRYGQSFEYMFVFSKGKPKTINKICDRLNKWSGTQIHGTSRDVNGETFRKYNDKKTNVKEYGERFNVWKQPSEKHNVTGHPAVFPVNLVKDHVFTWSNKGDVVLDIFLGSGTTAIACKELKRHFIGFEISQKYFEVCKERLADYDCDNRQISLEDYMEEISKESIDNNN